MQKLLSNMREKLNNLGEVQLLAALFSLISYHISLLNVIEVFFFFGELNVIKVIRHIKLHETFTIAALDTR